MLRRAGPWTGDGGAASLRPAASGLGGGTWPRCGRAGAALRAWHPGRGDAGGGFAHPRCGLVAARAVGRPVGRRGRHSGPDRQAAYGERGREALGTVAAPAALPVAYGPRRRGLRGVGLPASGYG